MTVPAAAAAPFRGSIVRSARAVLLVLAVWLAFSALQLAVGAALSKSGDTVWSRELLVDLTMAVYWAAVSFPIAAWHRRIRARSTDALRIVLLHVPLVVIVTCGDTLTTRLSTHYVLGYTLPAPFVATLTYFADFDVLSYLAVVIVVDALMARAAARKEERRAAKLESLLSRARLEYLEAQLQPHFLFNALGAVSELAYEAPATAVRVLRQIAHIFRNALNSRAGEVSLGEELVAIEPYLDIQRLRFPDWLRIDYDVAGDTLDCLVPRFVLQPLVENAIRHGLTGRVAAGCIEIAASVRNERLVLRVADNGVGLRQVPSRPGYGIGLNNVRERLTTLYGAGEQLKLLDAQGGGAIAEVTLPARRAMDVASEPPAPNEEDFRESALDASGSLAPAAMPSRPARAALVLAIWLACGFLWTLQSYAYLRIRNRMGTYTFLSILRHDVAAALGWACLAPIVFAATSRFPLTRSRLLVRVPAYLAGITVLAILHAVVLTKLFTPRVALWSQVNANTLILNFLILAVLVAIGHRRQLADWMRTRERAAAALSAELVAARERAARLQSIPPVVLDALDRAIEAVSADSSPQHTEQLLARLADYLRVAIECSDQEGLTESRQQSLARSLVHFERLARPLTPHPLTRS
jgi:hypothetical protein